MSKNTSDKSATPPPKTTSVSAGPHQALPGSELQLSEPASGEPIKPAAPTSINEEAKEKYWLNLRDLIVDRWDKLSIEELGDDGRDDAKITELVKSRYAISEEDVHQELTALRAQSYQRKG